MLTVLLGAGFSQGVNLPGTDAITQHVRGLSGYGVRGDDHREAPLSEILWKIAQSYYDRPNFEVLLHLTESMLSANRSRFGFTLPDSQKVAFNAFMDLAPRWENVLKDSSLSQFGMTMMANVADFLDEAIHQSSLEKTGVIYSFLFPLMKRDSIRLVTLNYDDAVERSVPEFWDGFESGNPGSVDYAGFSKKYNLEILHLHGSIRFAPPEHNAHAIPELRRYSTNTEAKKFRLARLDLTFFSQAGELLLNGPILSGLRKTEKLLLQPYGLYHHRFVDGLMTSPKLLCIGYGGNDTYVNGAIAMARRIHGDRFRAAYITKLDDHTDFQRPDVFQSLFLPASHVVSFSHEYPIFVERLKQAKLRLQQNGMLILGGGFPLSAEDAGDLISFLFQH